MLSVAADIRAQLPHYFSFDRLTPSKVFTSGIVAEMLQFKRHLNVLWFNHITFTAVY